MTYNLLIPANTSLLTALSRQFESGLTNGLLMLPEAVGTGFIQEYDLGSKLYLMIHHYELKVDLTLRREPVELASNTLVFSFRNVIKLPSEPPSISAWLPSVQVSSGHIDQTLFFPAHTSINTILITAQADVLQSILNAPPDDSFLQTVLPTTTSYLYEDLISPVMQAVATQLIEARFPPSLQSFYLKIKAQELICLFLLALSQRQRTMLHPLTRADAIKLFAVRDHLLRDLSNPPSLVEMAHQSGLSESKLTRLFRQVFGTSLYQYYQTLRLNEAARLLREQDLSVSEVGYRLGFTNLSHFSRLFEQHFKYKPKKYAKQGHASYAE